MSVRTPHRRRGALLIVVAGFCSLLAGLAVAFLARMRSDLESIVVVERQTQARVMLLAACDYVLEASRLGYDTSAGPVHGEAYGWIDIRDGTLGPKTAATGVDDASRFPLGSHARCPMHVL